MDDPTPDRDADVDTGPGADQDSTTGTPRWVKVSGAIALVVVVLFVALKLFGVGGEHGPGRHSGEHGGQVPPSSITEPDGDAPHTGPPPGFEHAE